MQRTYNTQQSDVNDMIRQVALLTEMIKEVQENKTRSEENSCREEEERASKAEGMSNAEGKSGSLPEKQNKIKTVEIESAEEETLVEEESIITPSDDEASPEILKEAHDGSPKKEEEVIGRDEKLDNTIFYLQSRGMQAPDQKVDEFTVAVEEENEPAKKSPPVIEESEGCCYREEPELKEERPRRKAARSIYWVQLQPWPESLRVEKPPIPGLRDKEKKEESGDLQESQEKAG